jgi:hypothetical protein
MTFPVAMHLWFSLVDTERFGDIIIIHHILNHRKNRFEQNTKRNDEYELFHAAKILKMVCFYFVKKSLFLG